MDEIVTKAQFEEAKQKEIAGRGAGMQPRTYLTRNRPGGPISRNTSSATTSPKALPHTPSSDPIEQSKNRHGKNVSCFQCGMEGHFRSNCPYPKHPKGGTESRGRTQVKSMTPHEKSDDTLPTMIKREIQALRERLRLAELDDAIESSGALNLVVPAGERSRLGPTVYAPVSVGGVSTDALVDTGSPATIVSLEFALKVFQHNRPKEQTNAQWIESTHKQFKDPDITLKNYGGHQLDFIAQVEFTLSRGDRQLTSTVLVRKDAPNDLLVGTDVQPKLGFSLVTKDDDGGTTDLFTGQRSLSLDSKTSQLVSGNKSQEPNVDTSLVNKPAYINPDLNKMDSGLPVEYELRLLQAVKTPAGMQKVVRATIGDVSLQGPLMFTPSELSSGLQMADSVVEMREDKFVMLVLQNMGVEKEYLRKGAQLGVISAPTLLSGDKQDRENKVRQDAELSRLQGPTMKSPVQDGTGGQEWINKLFTQLNVDFSHLVEDDQGSLRTLLTSYADVFALDSSELGTTELVTHSIDTGQHHPIKQPLRRIPFALRSKVEELVDEMLRQGVVEPSASP